MMQIDMMESNSNQKVSGVSHEKSNAMLNEGCTIGLFWDGGLLSIKA